MLERFDQIGVDTSETKQRAADVAEMADDATNERWDELVRSRPMWPIWAESAEMVDSAWEGYGPGSAKASKAICGFADTAAPHAQNALDAAVDVATDVAYVGASGALGVADFVEGAVFTVPVWVDVARGEREEAEGLLEERFFYGLIEPLQEALHPSEQAIQAGETAFNTGEIAAGVAAVGVATVAVATSAPAVATAATAVAALGVAGEVLHHGYEEDGELTDETVAASGVAAVVAVLGITIAGNALAEAVPETAGEAARIHTINEGLVGGVHPETGVPFNEVQVRLPSGEVVEGVFPDFESVIDVQLPPELYDSSNYLQFQNANQALYDALQSMPELRHMFSPEQILQIADGVFTGQAPDGFVWHHNEQVGLLQLVDSATHAATGHTGGQAIWGAARR